MYLAHYQLKLKPFEIGPDPQFLWLGEKHQEAFAVLKYGVLENKGFIVLIGEPGTGKSTLLNAVVGSFGSSTRFAKIPDPALNEMDFFNFVADALGTGGTFDSKAEFLIHLQQFVSRTAARSEKVVLVIDEAQRLPPELLEQIRILANFEGPKQKVISCIFAGQNEFLGMVKHNPAMSQRVFFSHIIQPLTETETGAYIEHRLKVAGAAAPIFSPSAVREVFLLSAGNPRLINVVCDQALLSGYAANRKTIGATLVRESTKDTFNACTPQPGAPALAAAAETSSPAAPAERLAEASGDSSQDAPVKSRRGPIPIKAAYWAAMAWVVVLGLAGFQYCTGGTAPRSSDPPALTTDAGELKAARERVSQLEEALSDRSRGQQQLEQRIKNLEKDLALEKQSKVRLGAELSSREAVVVEMGKALESLKADQVKLETEISGARNDNARLQSQVQDLKVQRPSAPPEPPPARIQPATPPDAPPAAQAEASPDPADIIDFVIKMKSR
jgi:type II secretory pathway predicted ATPase ExeA